MITSHHYSAAHPSPENKAYVDAFMKANIKRDGDAAHWYYPMLMKGEWPVLLKILGKGEGDERYLSVAEVRTLFVERRLNAHRRN